VSPSVGSDAMSPATMTTPASRRRCESDSGRTSAPTSWPRSRNFVASSLPIYPVAPVRKTRKLLLLFHGPAERERHRALPFRGVAVVHELHVLLALGRGLRRFDAEGDALPLRIDAHHAHDHLLPRFVGAGRIGAGRHGDFRA